MTWRRIAKLVGTALALWLGGLVFFGFACGEERGRDIASRLGESLGGESTLADTDLALVRGFLELDQLRVARDDEVGRLRLEVDHARCDLAPLGGALFDRTCGELALSGLSLEASSFDLFRIKRPRRAPFRAGAVRIEDARFALPGPVEVALAHAIAGETTFKTPLSWVFSLASLTARVSLPIGSADIRYVHNTLVISGGLFPRQPVVIPLPLPVKDPDDDPRDELRRITAWGKPVLARLAKEYLRQALGR